MCVGKVDNACIGTIRDGIYLRIRAPLKSQQGTSTLRSNLLPRLLNKAAHGRTIRGTLECMDRISRSMMMDWLRMPKDSPSALIHADSRDGGLAVDIFRLLTPVLRIKRTSMMAGSSDPVVRQTITLPVFRRDERRWCKPLNMYGLPDRAQLCKLVYTALRSIGPGRCLQSLPHTSSPGSAIGRLRLAAHVGSARKPRVRINSARIWPRAAVRQISVVFNIFRLVHPKAHHGCVVCEGPQVCSEKQYDTGQ